MAHKTLIGGTAYQIKGGKTLVGGTAYSISKGKTLVGGTTYEIRFKTGIRILLIMSPLDLGYMKYSGTVTIGGVTYNANSSNATLDFPGNTSITCKAAATGAGNTGHVYWNGTIVAQVTATESKQVTVEYTGTLTGNGTVKVEGKQTSNGMYSDIFINVQ